MDKDMANANTGSGTNLPTVKQVQPFGIRRGTRMMLGSCNNCSSTSKHRVVTEINLKGLVFRLCDNCKGKLKKLL